MEDLNAQEIAGTLFEEKLKQNALTHFVIRDVILSICRII